MKKYKIGQVFEDTENFEQPKRLKCVDACDTSKCAYEGCVCDDIGCLSNENDDGIDRMFIETEEPVTEDSPSQAL